MRQRHKFVMQFPGRLGFCSTTVAIKVLFLLVSLLLLVLFLQNMFYAVYAKFNLHEIRLVHQQSSWNEKPAKMVELHQMTSNLNESQRLRRITLQLSFAHYIFLLSKLERTYKPHYHYQNFSPLANGTDLNREKYAILQTHWH